MSLVALVALAIAGVAAYTAYSHSQLTQIDDTLQRAHEPIEQAVNRPDAELQVALAIAAPGLYVALLRSDGVPRFVIPAYEVGHAPLTADLDDVTLPPAEPGSYVDRPYYSTLESTS